MKEYVEKSMTFAEYVKLIDDLLLDGKTTGTIQSEAMFNYGKLNRQRMHRLEKTVNLDEPLKKEIRALDVNWVWLVITEGWCGDAAQNIPVIEKIAAENARIQTRYVLRDENLELTDRYLTNNARSIPKLICLDAKTLEEVGTWGPRPQIAMEYYLEMRDSGMEKSQMMENMQRWYLQDKEKSVKAEFSVLLDAWANGEKEQAVTF